MIGTPIALAQQFTLRYNDPFRETQTYDALGNLTRNFYDSEGNLIRKIDAESRVLHLKYDTKGRLRCRWSDDQSVDSHYEWDFADRLISAREGPVHYRWHYDSAGRITRHDQTISERINSVLYEYDTSGRLTQKSIDQSWWVQYHYSPESSFISKVDIPGATVAVRADLAGRIMEEHWDDGGCTRYEYLADGALASLESYNEHRQLVFGQRLVRDDRGRPVREIRQYPDREVHYQYHYDVLNRLERVDLWDEGKAAEFRRYVYDERGNRLEEYRDGALYATYRYDQANRLIEMHCGRGESKIFEYDRCGNLVSEGRHIFYYDAAQRLRQVSLMGTLMPVVECGYAATNERVLIARPQGVERIFYDGAEEILSESSTGQRASYWGFFLDTLLAISAGQSTQRAYTTSIGSVIAVGSSTDPKEYDPFGDVTTHASQPMLFGFCGKRYDVEIGLYYGRARLYDPVSGRFTQPDPIGLGDGPNMYLYARNNPLVNLDPLGLASVKSSQGSVWNLGPAERGRYIEDVRGQNLPENYPVIDRCVREWKYVVSIKSIDLARSYQGEAGAKALERTLYGYIDKLNAFSGRTWAGVTVPKPEAKTLEIVIPSSGASWEQARAIVSAQDYGASKDVAVRAIKLG
jgi:RHS repeat-associated protein